MIPFPTLRSTSVFAPPARPPRPDIIVVGASAGGFPPLLALLRGLPPDLPAAVFVTIHLAEHRPSILSDMLGKAGPLGSSPVSGQGEPIRYGRVYAAAPGRHLLVTARRVRNGRGPKVRWYRPSIDRLFQSAAAAFGPRVVGIVLSGYLQDGSAGLQEIRRCGGTTVVQSLDDAEVGDMPRNAMALGKPDYCVPGRWLAPLVARLTHGAGSER